MKKYHLKIELWNNENLTKYGETRINFNEFSDVLTFLNKKNISFEFKEISYL